MEIDKKKVRSSAFLLLLLILLFFFSFFRNKDIHSERIQSVLLNSKYVDDLSVIQIDDPAGESISLKKENGIWFGISQKKSDGDSVFRFPAEQQFVSNFIKQFSNIQNMYKISDSQTSWHSLGLTNAQAFSVTMLGTHGNMYTKLYFGRRNFDDSMIYVRNNRNLKSYQLDAAVSSYLSTRPETWCDPLLIPQVITGHLEQSAVQKISFNDTITKTYSVYYPSDGEFLSVVKKLRELRHGTIQKKLDTTDYNSSLRIELGSGTVLDLRFKKLSAEKKPDWSVCYTYTFGPAENWKQHLVSVFNYTVLVSNWTYTTITELFEKKETD
jgi:hypothetical protein